MSDEKLAGNKRRIPVSVDGQTYVSLKEYSEQTRVPITEAVTEALNDWLVTVGVARLEAINKTRVAMKNVLTFPAIQQHVSDESN